MSSSFIKSLALAVFVIVLGACHNARPIETGGTESITSIEDVDMQDIMKASSGMLESMLSLGVLSQAQHKPAQVIIGQVVNDTSSRFDVGEMTYRMREQLVNSGQAVVVTTWGANAEDPTAQAEMRRKAILAGKTEIEGVQPDFSLSGKITQMMRQSGNTRQGTFTFRLTLTNLNTGLEAWTKTVDMTKQGNKNSVGF
ncbi:MAG: hypothetical protein EXS00_06185 [Phycisphaerales bacterium]|nr:hypothetical protein [Phycisphaerales bacterium]